jgi:hypothetical protein
METSKQMEADIQDLSAEVEMAGVGSLATDERRQTQYFQSLRTSAMSSGLSVARWFQSEEESKYKFIAFYSSNFLNPIFFVYGGKAL